MKGIEYLPVEFTALSGQINYIQSHGFGEYTSSCPRCGGTPHRNGEPPDRFCMWPNSKTTGGPFGWCRKCGYKWWPGKNDKENEPTIEEMQEWERQREQINRELAEIQKNKREYLKQEDLYKIYHDNLTGEIYKIYDRRGIPESFVNYWWLGYCARKPFYYNGDEFYADTLTIPIFKNMENRNIKHRLLNHEDYGKYRYELSKMPDYPFYANLEDGNFNKVIVVEGEFKAMVVFILLSNLDIQVIGLPSSSPSPDTLNEIKQIEAPKWFILDPDTYISNNGFCPVKRMENYFAGERFIDLPNKVDDMINNGSLELSTLKGLMITARKAVAKN